MEIKKHENHIVSTFNEIVPVYDLMNHLLSAGFDLFWRFKASKFVQGNTLDLCTGKGEMIDYMSRSNNTLFVGIDLSMEMLKRFRYLRADAYVIKANAKQLPFKDNLFRTVVCAFGIRNIDDWMALLKDTYRILKPRGRLVVLELTLPDFPIRWIFTLYLKTVLPLLGRLVAKNGKAYEYLAESIFYFDERKRILLKQMEIAGFRNLQVKELTLGVATIFTGEKGKERNGRAT